MSHNKLLRQSAVIESELVELKLENGLKSRERDRSRPKPKASSQSANTVMKSASHSPVKKETGSHSSTPTEEKQEAVVGGDVTLKMEPGEPLKLARTASQKIKKRPPHLYNDAKDRTMEAQKHFDMLPECTYSNKSIGSTEHGSMDCDCEEEWDGVAKVNAACGDNSDCINRATKMECVGDCGCGSECQNQRFQQRQFAPVTVFETDKKGYGLRADADMDPDDFIYEYIGEVIGETQFRKRMINYDEEGIKHFYFMSLTQGEFVDATKKGNLGRFCNHSCNPNCFVDKWVVGEKLRMGIFAERKIKAGEELTFNYNVDRYGADPQPCYCDESNCTGFIGGKTQTERATKLSHTTIEALGIDDGDGWDTAVAKKPRKKKAGEDDEEYVNNVQPKSLDEHGVTKVMATLMQCKEKWIAVKLLSRVQGAEDEKVRARVVKMHGYQILGSNLALWKEDANVVLQIFDILDNFPRITRNKIADSKIEATVEGLKGSQSEKVASKAGYLLREWATLEVAYRIPRKKREIDTAATPEKLNRFALRGSRDDRKARSRSGSKEGSRSSSKSIETPKGPSAPSGPRNNFPQRQPGFHAAPRPPYRPRQFNSGLPEGWFAHQDPAGRTYYFNLQGTTTWEKPKTAVAVPPPPTKPKSANQKLEDIISEITNAKGNTPKEKVPQSTIMQPTASNIKGDISSGREKWRALPEEKQMKLYENTIFPHVKYVMDKFKGKLPKDDLKRFAKEISKKLVSSDFKNKRVDDPTKINSKREKQVRSYVKEYFDKAAKKHKEREHRRAERKVKQAIGVKETTSAPTAEIMTVETPGENSDGDEEMMVSDKEDNPKQNPKSTTPLTPMDPAAIVESLKRKRNDPCEADGVLVDDPEATPKKLLKPEAPPPPPPPPPEGEGSFQSPIGPPFGVTNGYHGAYDSPMSLDREAASEEPLTGEQTADDAPPSPTSPVLASARARPNGVQGIGDVLSDSVIENAASSMMGRSPTHEPSTDDLEHTHERRAIET
ncbi:uncharacterized protein KY384_003710 [Bacidia gigantensis]|uniref:uncharacterized protein n=1 Tax=Bacidia gigantensis TaxID=2732470 RepID=UPI001D0492EA|nr:uncharacterized protein KY384_003710 [Bacidia gigantensis]KAG8532073.1 hypothetical protein KY384_003710 [Bacidia gigantensis]